MITSLSVKWSMVLLCRQSGISANKAAAAAVAASPEAALPSQEAIAALQQEAASAHLDKISEASSQAASDDDGEAFLPASPEAEAMDSRHSAPEPAPARQASRAVPMPGERARLIKVTMRCKLRVLQCA